MASVQTCLSVTALEDAARETIDLRALTLDDSEQLVVLALLDQAGHNFSEPRVPLEKECCTSIKWRLPMPASATIFLYIV